MQIPKCERPQQDHMELVKDALICSQPVASNVHLLCGVRSSRHALPFAMAIQFEQTNKGTSEATWLSAAEKVASRKLCITAELHSSNTRKAHGYQPNSTEPLAILSK